MKLSYNWMKELVPDLSATPAEVAEKLTMHSFETSVVGNVSIDPAIKVVKILAVEPHPNADRLRLATITDGQQEIRIVCGAPNIAVGQIVPYAPLGAKVYDADGTLFTIKDAVIRGEKSPGMLNSARELGLGADHGGIFVLPPETALGSRLSEVIPPDTILDTEMTPNRAHDALSHVGVAREIAALYQLRVQEPAGEAVPAAQEDVDGFTISIKDAPHTPRYMNILLQGAQNEVSPLWLQARLLSLGVRPISAIVDITNYVLLEVGQPSHAFDSHKLPGKKISVRLNKREEKIALLNGEERELPPNTLVVTSDDTPVALAGIMGGSGSAVDEETTDIVLEIANFHPFTIHQAATALGLRTEASIRFTKAIAPGLVDAAAGRLVYLLESMVGAKVVGVVEQYPEPQAPQPIPFNPQRVSIVAGTPIDLAKIQTSLTALRATVDATAVPWQVTPPADRLDLRGEHDLMEEIIRLHGLNSIPAATLTLPSTFPSQLASVVWRDKIREILIAYGVTETINIPFEAPLADFIGDGGDKIELSNPLAPEQRYLRTTLRPGILANFVVNKDDFHKKFSTQTKALFEIGHVYSQKSDSTARVPGIEENEHLAVVLVGSADDSTALFAKIGEIVQTEVTADMIVWSGPLPDSVLKKMKFRVQLTGFEINLSLLYSAVASFDYTPPRLANLAASAVAAPQFHEFSRYPSILRDISYFVAAEHSAQAGETIIKRVGAPLVVATEAFDEFIQDKTGQKSLAFHVEYQALDRTLTAADVEEVHNLIIEALEAELGAHIR